MGSAKPFNQTRQVAKVVIRSGEEKPLLLYAVTVELLDEVYICMAIEKLTINYGHHTKALACS